MDATLNSLSFSPTITYKDMYYTNNDHINNNHYLWMVKNKDAINAMRRANYARKNHESLMLAIAGKLGLDLDSLTQ